MLKLRTMYLYSLNETLDIYEDDQNVNCLSLPRLRLFQRDQTCRHDNMKGISISN